MKQDQYKAILFDSGRVLNQSRSEHWFIGPRFFESVNQNIFDSIDSKKVKEAFKGGLYEVERIALIATQEEELVQFQKFYQTFAKGLPELELGEDDINALAYDLVYNPSKYQFYDDALQVIPTLAKQYKLGVVSDAWPSLEGVFEEVNLRPYFSSFVISSQLGVVKPDAKMYQTALDELGVDAKEAMFIDDNLRNCLGAKSLGIHAVLICRDKKVYMLEKIRSLGKGYAVISSLSDLKL